MSNAQDLYKKLIETAEATNQVGIARGEYLLEMRDKYQEITGDGSEWLDFLALPELKCGSYTSANRLMAIAQKYRKELKLKYSDLAGLDTLSLYNVRKVVTKENYKDWFEKIRNLSRSDIDHLLKFGDKDQVSCKHEFEPMPAKYKCKICGVITNHKQ